MPETLLNQLHTLSQGSLQHIPYGVCYTHGIRREVQQMIFTQYYLDCLSQASYLIGDEATGRAAVVDPRRDIQEYLADARQAGLAIELVIETHFHADFISGHLELAAATGATIVYGEGATAAFDHRTVSDGERHSLGDIQLEFRATPGHTPESISIVVWEHADDNVPFGVLTGDTLFIGDVGRPDLLASAGVTADTLARALYKSVHAKLLTLPDSTRVFPGHGAGSACGKNLSTETSSTIGAERASNYALAPMTESDFVAIVTDGQSVPPPYFGYDAALNKADHALLDSEPPALLSLDAALERQARGATLVDVRPGDDFAHAHIPGSLNVPLDGRVAEYAATVVNPQTEVVIVAPETCSAEAKIRLGRVGFDNMTGALESPERDLARRPDLADIGARITPSALRDRMREISDLSVIDVRNATEVAAGSIAGSTNIPLPELPSRLGSFDLTRPVVVYCAGGYRSTIAASVLRASGADDVSDLAGGYAAFTASAAAEPA